MKQWFEYGGVIGALAAMLFGCGYHFSGSGSYPAGVSKVFIAILENRSAETGVESTFTNDLIYEFTRNREESLVEDRSAADAILTGSISRISVADVSRSSISTAVQRRVTGILNLRLESPDGRLLWSSGNLVEKQAFAVVDGNRTATDQKKSEAIADVSRKLAESAFNRLTDNF